MMKYNKSKYIILISGILSIFLTTKSKAQTFMGNITFTVQADINTFGSTYTSISGNLTIGDGDITDLTPLAKLTTIGGNLSVSQNSSLTNLVGLDGISSIGGNLYIHQNSLQNLNGLNISSVGGDINIAANDMLSNIDALTSITSLAGGIYIDNNPALTNLNGLSNFTSVNGILDIGGNSGLTNLDGLSSFTAVGGSLSIYNDILLENINGLNSITSVGGEIDIIGIPSITNLDALGNIVTASKIVIQSNSSLTDLSGISTISLSGTLDIEYNESLTNLDDLIGFTSIAGSFLLVGNSSLTNLDGLNSITSLGGGIYIDGNTSLSSFCGLFPLLNGGFTGSYYVADNAINPTQQEIIYGGACSALPVELTTFSASVVDNKVELKWNTATEVNNYGFNVERKLQNGSWMKIGFVKGNGNSNSPKQYSFIDNPSGGTQFQYRLKQIDNDGKFEYSKIIEIALAAPAKFLLEQNYPNPFNPSTTIRYEIPNAEYVTLKVYDILGNEVETLVDKEEQAGSYSIQFSDVRNQRLEVITQIASGIYFYRLQTGSFVQTKKMLLLK